MTCDICSYAVEHGSWPQWLLNKGGTHCSTQYASSGKVLVEGCHRTWTAKKEAHCLGRRADGAECHQHFSTDGLADKHREHGHCLPPTELALRLTKNGENVFAQYLTPDGGVLWRHPQTLNLKPAFLVGDR